jgi:hypothetical protein
MVHANVISVVLVLKCLPIRLVVNHVHLVLTLMISVSVNVAQQDNSLLYQDQPHVYYVDVVVKHSLIPLIVNYAQQVHSVR